MLCKFPLAAVFGFATILWHSGGKTVAAPSSNEEQLPALIGSNVCTRGPSYWCQNHTTARECNANMYCVERVWNHHIQEADRCSICHMIVKMAREMLKSPINQVVEVLQTLKVEDVPPCEECEHMVEDVRDVLAATVKDFKQVLLGICSHTMAFKKECVNNVKTYVPVIYDILTKELNGKVICSLIGTCPRSSGSLTIMGDVYNLYG